jgi:hypothetical protein
MDVWPYVARYGALSGHSDQVHKIAFQTRRSVAEVEGAVAKAFARVAGVMLACAGARGYVVRWGGDWDNDGDLMDQEFHDLPHFELVRHAQ